VENFIAIIFLVFRVAMIGSLYGFLAWAIWVLWRDFRVGSNMDRDNIQPTECIGLFDLDKKRFHLLTSQSIILGRDQNCDFYIDDNSVSAKHARLSYHHNQWCVEDLDSKNGTYLNHGMLSGVVALTSGDTIHVGNRNYEIILNHDVDDRKIHDEKFNDTKGLFSH